MVSITPESYFLSILEGRDIFPNNSDEDTITGETEH